MSSRPRDPLGAVGAAVRNALGAATSADPPLRVREWRVLAAVVQLTGAYTRLEDTVSHHQLGRHAGLDKPHERRTLARELRSLSSRGLITYTPGTSTPDGGRTTSRIGLPPADTDPRHESTPGQDRPPVGTGTDPRSAPAQTPGRDRPPSRGDSRVKEPEEEQRRVSQASHDVDVSEVARDLCRYFVTEHCHPNSHGVPTEGTKAHATWLREMDRLVRIGPPNTNQGVDPDRIRKVIAWMASHRGNGDFPGWSAVCESVPTFRKKFTKIAASADAASRNGSGRPPAQQVSEFTYSGRVQP